MMLAGCQPSDTSILERGASVREQIRGVNAGTTDTIDCDEPIRSQADWELLRGVKQIRSFTLREGIAGDREASIIGSLTSLERLSLRHSPLGDDGFREIASLQALVALNIPQADCTERGLESLSSLPHLQSLRLGSSRLDGLRACEILATFPALKSLHLIDIHIKDQGLLSLSQCKTLRSLYLDNAGVSQEAWGEYIIRQPLVHVHIDQAHHDRDPIKNHPSAVESK